MKKVLLSLTLLLMGVSLFSQVGDDRLKELNTKAAKDATMGWIKGGGAGFDLTGLGIRNPRVGAGLNRFGLGGLGTFFINKKADNSYWDNNASLQLGVVRLGSNDEPFQKSIDVLRLASKAGYAITANKKWFATGLFIGTTNFLKTYEGNLLNDGDGTRSLFSRFLSPAQLQLHPGIEWKPDAHFSLLISPIGLNMIYVGDDVLAAKNIHGNELGKNSRVQLVPALQAGYTNKFFNDRVTYTSALNLTTNYLKNPFVISALNFWQNNLSFAITKNLSLDLFGEAAYDHYKFIQVNEDRTGGANPKLEIGKINPITVDGEIPTTDGPDRLGRGTQMVGSFLLKYNKIF